MTLFFLILAALSFLYLIFFFFIAPALKKHPDESLLQGAKIAHRGLHNETFPENSIPSFKNAIKNNYAIEIDLHLSKDGKVIVFHDSKTNRMCGQDGKIELMTLKEIKALRLSDTDNTIPTLEECLDAVKGQVPLLIEFKVVNNNTKELCQAANEILSRYHGKYLVQSFYPQVLYWYRKHRKDVCRGLLASRFVKGPFYRRLQGKMFFNFLGRPHFISYDQHYSNGIIWRYCVWLGATAVGWTFRSQEELIQNSKYFSSWIFEGFSPEINTEAPAKKQKQKGKK